MHAPHARPRNPDTKAVHVRISARTSLHAPHTHIRIPCGMRDHSWHHHTHVQLHAQGHHLGNEVSVILHKRKTHMLAGLVHLAQSSTLDVHALDVERSIVVRILRPPKRREPPQPDIVLHEAPAHHNDAFLLLCRHLLHEALADGREAVRITRVHPRRNPRQMFHSALQLLPLPRPVHRRRAHIAAHGGQLPYQRLRHGAVLSSQYLPQATLGHHTTTLQAETRTPDGVPINAKPFPPRLRQEQSVHHRPKDPVPPRTTHELTCTIPKQMLHPVLHRNCSTTAAQILLV